MLILRLLSLCAGFAVIQWWASVGLVACHWTAGEDQEAEAYYPAIEGMLGDRCVCVFVQECIPHECE